jgi:hypothetical protein
MRLEKRVVRTISPSSYSTPRRPVIVAHLTLLQTSVFLFLYSPPILAEPSSLQLRILEGDGLSVKAGAVSYRGFTIQVRDRDGVPVPGAEVMFRLPEQEPTGQFPGGSRTDRQTTDAQGKASTWGIRWGQAGTCHVSITASLKKLTAGTAVRVQVEEPAPAAASQPDGPSFEVEVKPQTVPPASQPDPAAEAAAAPQRPQGVFLERTTRLDEPIPGAKRKWVAITALVASGIGGLVAYRLTRQATPPAVPAAPVEPVLTLRLGNISVGKP